VRVDQYRYRRRRDITNLYRTGKIHPSSTAYLAGDDDAAAKAADVWGG
jgi:hypothetical protein